MKSVNSKEMEQNREKAYNEIEIPELINFYNSNMGGVDKLDQMLSYCMIFIKCKKWTLRMITHAIDLAIVNSWLEYNKEATRCKNKDSKGKTHVLCTKCQVHLCLLSYINCFLAFHT